VLQVQQVALVALQGHRLEEAGPSSAPLHQRLGLGGWGGGWKEGGGTGRGGGKGQGSVSSAARCEDSVSSIVSEGYYQQCCKVGNREEGPWVK
jgi:hypothetical protein